MSASRGLAAVLDALACSAAVPAEASAKTVWLCKPGLKADPCASSLDTARFSPTGQKLASETPVYRQVRIAGLVSDGITSRLAVRAYRDVRAAWGTYLRRFNHGRGVVLIGHSHGTLWLRRLIREGIEPRAKVRRRLVSALLLGGNVTVRRGEDAGGDFRRVRACRSNCQLGCVIASSTFDAPVPVDSLFGRTSERFSGASPPGRSSSARPGLEVLCTNPAALGGGEALVDTLLPRAPFAPGTVFGNLGSQLPSASTAWLSFPGSYSARCSSDDGAHVLQITPRGGAPVLRPTPAATSGLHLADANIALGDVARLVRRQAAEYVRSR